MRRMCRRRPGVAGRSDVVQQRGTGLEAAGEGQGGAGCVRQMPDDPRAALFRQQHGARCDSSEHCCRFTPTQSSTALIRLGGE